MTEIEKNPLPICEEHELHREKIEAGRRNMPPELELYRLSDFFKVLGDSTRIKILFAIDGGALCVCDIAELVGMTKSAVSHQLKILRSSKLIKARRDGKMMLYSLADEHVKTIIAMGMDHVEE